MEFKSISQLKSLLDENKISVKELREKNRPDGSVIPTDGSSKPH